MARKTIGSKLAYLARKFPHRNSFGFLYDDAADLKRKFSTIYVAALIYDPERGHSLFMWNPHRRGKDWTPRRWNTWLNEQGLDILSANVMSEVNNKRGAQWQMTRLIGFFGGIYEPRKIHIVGEDSTAMYQHEAQRAIHKRHTRRKGKRGPKTHVKR